MARMFLAVLFLAACGTGYHAKGLSGGYSEIRLSERAFQVNFEGNGYTGQLAAQQGALRRAAELAYAYGYAAFWVSNQGNTVDSQLISQPLSCANGYCSGGNTSLVQRPTATMTANMLTREEAAAPPPGITVYDAGTILAQQ